MKTMMVAFLGLVAISVRAGIVEREIGYTHGEQRFAGMVVYDSAREGPRPGVMIVHQWSGPGRYERYRARLLAEHGYAVFVADIYGRLLQNLGGRGGPRPSSVKNKRIHAIGGRQASAAVRTREVLQEPHGLDAEGTPIRPAPGPAARDVAESFRAGDRRLFRDRMKLALSVMRDLPETDPQRLAAVGYCFGGTGVLELARDGADIRAVISVHGGLDSPAPQDGANIRSSVLMLHASHDPTTPPDQIAALIAELDAHRVDWQLNYYAHHGHSFTDPESSGYNPVADRRAWTAMLVFLQEHLRLPGIGPANSK